MQRSNFGQVWESLRWFCGWLVKRTFADKINCHWNFLNVSFTTLEKWKSKFPICNISHTSSDLVQRQGWDTTHLWPIWDPPDPPGNTLYHQNWNFNFIVLFITEFELQICITLLKVSGRQTDWLTDPDITGKQTDKLVSSNKYSVRLITKDRHASRLSNYKREIDKKIERQTDKQADRQTDKQTDRETDRQADR